MTSTYEIVLLELERVNPSNHKEKDMQSLSAAEAQAKAAVEAEMARQNINWGGLLQLLQALPTLLPLLQQIFALLGPILGGLTPPTPPLPQP